jgi:hypothetical protein
MSLSHEELASPAPVIKFVGSETLPLTRELAETMHKMTPSPTERELNSKRVEHLREKLLAGLFHPPYWVKAIVDGNEYRANGQHSSAMLVQANGHFPEGLVAHLDTFECSGMDALALLFRQFDDRKSARSPADIAGAYQGLQNDLDELPRHIGKLGVEGICWCRQFVAALPVKRGDDKYEIFQRRRRAPVPALAGRGAVNQDAGDDAAAGCCRDVCHPQGVGGRRRQVLARGGEGRS